MTNTLTFIATITITSLLATNKTIEYPKRWVPEPCPDKLPGCAVNHTRVVDDTEAGVRFLVTTVTETRKTHIEGPKYTNSFYDPPVVIRREQVEEKLQINWVRGSSAALTFRKAPVYLYSTNINVISNVLFFSNTNIVIFTNSSGGLDVRLRSSETNLISK